MHLSTTFEKVRSGKCIAPDLESPSPFRRGIKGRGLNMGSNNALAL